MRTCAGARRRDHLVDDVREAVLEVLQVILETSDQGGAAAGPARRRRARRVGHAAKPHAGERRVGEAADRAGDARSGLAQRGCPRRRNQADRTAARPADPACRPRADRPATVETTPVAGADDTSQLVYILPGIALTLLLAAGLGYAIRTSR